MARTLTAPERLDLLLPWINGDFEALVGPYPPAMHIDYAAIRQAVAAFLGSFDGSEGAGFLAVEDVTGPRPTDEELGLLGAGLRIAFAQGFGDAGVESERFPITLFFAIRSAGRQRPGWRGGVKGGVRSGIAGGSRLSGRWRVRALRVRQHGGSRGVPHRASLDLARHGVATTLPARRL